jgi:hypothetical protein
VNKHARQLQALVYLLAGCAFAWLIVMRMLLIVWGVPLHPLLFVALLAAVAVAAGGVVSLARPERGRLVAACGLAGFLVLWFPWLISVVPEHNIIPSPLSYLAVAGYLFVAAFASFYPTRSWPSVSAFVLVVLAGIATLGLSYRQRERMGEYDRPSIACFRWDPRPSDTLVIARDPFGCIDEQAKSTLTTANLHGTLSWCGGSTRETAQRVLVVAQARPPEDSRIFYPRSGLLVYAFDGKAWTKIPAQAETYALYSTFQSSGSDTMICSDDFSGGRTCTACLQWR